jgi:hypothetical protein
MELQLVVASENVEEDILSHLKYKNIFSRPGEVERGE